jgi:hypothetical protein
MSSINFCNPMCVPPTQSPATEVITQFFNSVQSGDYPIALNFPYGMTIVSMTLQAFQVTTPASIALKIDGEEAITGTADTTKRTSTPDNPSTVNAGQDLTFTATTDVDGVVGLSVSIALTRAS